MQVICAVHARARRRTVTRILLDESCPVQFYCVGQWHVYNACRYDPCVLIQRALTFLGLSSVMIQQLHELLETEFKVSIQVMVG